MNGLDGAQLQLEVGNRVLRIGSIIDTALPGLVGEVLGQRTQSEQGAYEKLCQPKAKAHPEPSLLVFCGEVNLYPYVLPRFAPAIGFAETAVVFLTRLEPFDDRPDPLAEADAHGLQGVARPLEFP